MQNLVGLTLVAMATTLALGAQSNRLPACPAKIWFTGEGASNESGVVVNGDFRFFRSLYLPNLHIEGHNYYIVLCSRLVTLH